MNDPGTPAVPILFDPRDISGAASHHQTWRLHLPRQGHSYDLPDDQGTWKFITVSSHVQMKPQERTDDACLHHVPLNLASQSLRHIPETEHHPETQPFHGCSRSATCTYICKIWHLNHLEERIRNLIRIQFQVVPMRQRSTMICQIIGHVSMQFWLE